MEKNKIKKSLAVFASVLLIIIIGVASFAYFGTFNVNLNNNVAVNINSSSPGNATFTSNATQLNLQVPAANMSFTAANNTMAAKEDTAYLDVTLTGSANLLTTCTYDIVYEYDGGSNVYGQGTTTKTSGATKEITLEVNGMNGNNHFAIETNFDHANVQSYYDSTNKYYKLVENATIKSLGTEQSVRWKIIGRYYNLEASQSQLSGQAFTGKIYVVNKGCSSEDGTSVQNGYQTILANNGGAASMITLTSTDFAAGTTEKGMYKATDDLGTSYYFRGAVDNNWVKYGKYTKDTYAYWYVYNDNGWTTMALTNDCTGKGKCYKIASKGDDMYWRIIRVNGDNSIRMIYAGTYAPDTNTKVNMEETVFDDDGWSTSSKTFIGYSKFNINYNSAEYVGYMYTIGQQHGTGTDSTIKTYLDDWYANYTNLNATGTKITDQIFCNDRTASTDSSGTPGEISSWASTGTRYYYGPYVRLYGDSSNPSPSLICTNANDKFTTTTAKGNGKLSYPVGLITADEVNMAGADNKYNSNQSYYLYTGDYQWVGSSNVFRGGNASEFFVTGYGSLNWSNVDVNLGIRGVVSLSSDAKLLGSGTYDDVYTVN